MTRSSSSQTILLAQLDAIFGLHPGFRPAHAKGAMLSGTFAPSPEARSLTRAPHVTRESTPVTVRFSDGTGLPLIPDNLPDANPRGLAIRFHLADRVHTDIVSHSTVGFPTRTGQEFRDFLRAAATGDPSAFLATHPAALAFVQTPKPSAASFATEAYFGVTAFRFINQQGLARHGRYCISPKAGVEHLDDAAARRRARTTCLTNWRAASRQARLSSTSMSKSQMTTTWWMTTPRFIGLAIVPSFISAQSN